MTVNVMFITAHPNPFHTKNLTIFVTTEKELTNYGACSSPDTKFYSACVFIQINLSSPEEQVAASKLLFKVFLGPH